MAQFFHLSMLFHAKFFHHFYQFAWRILNFCVLQNVRHKLLPFKNPPQRYEQISKLPNLWGEKKDAAMTTETTTGRRH